MGMAYFADETATTRVEFQLVDPATRLPVDHFVDLRTDLSAAEWTDLDAGFIRTIGGDRSVHVSLPQVEAQRLALWVASWSLTTNRGAPVRPTVETMRNLRGPVQRRILELVEEHERMMRDEREAVVDPIAPASSTVEAASE